jgi:hypothetical protein
MPKLMHDTVNTCKLIAKRLAKGIFPILSLAVKRGYYEVMVRCTHS